MTMDSIHTWEELGTDGKWHKKSHAGYGSGLAIKFSYWVTTHYKGTRNHKLTYTEKPTTLRDLYDIDRALKKNGIA
jgi:hypothetical protein